MEKVAGKKLAAAIVIVVIMLAAAGTLIFALGKRQTYRLIKVYDTEDGAVVSREEQGELAAYANMVLQSGDRVQTADGRLTLRMDDDKYAYMEPKSRVLIEASGNQKNSRTKLVLEEGSLLNEIQNPLSDSSSYEVNTPNSTMSVRGTVFYTFIYEDEQGIRYTKISVIEGKVSTRLIYADGTAADQEVMVEAGKETIIYEDGKTTDYLNGVQDIDYSQLPEAVIRTLIRIAENGRTLAVSADELKKYLPDQASQEDTSEQTATEVSTATDEAITTQEDAAQTGTTEDVSTENAGKSYKVTFLYGDSVFGTQSVKSGEKAAKPTLKPASAGDWDYDFDKAVTSDITIKWK